MFDVLKIKNEIIQWIREQFTNSNHKAIVGVSGGKDSSIVCALLCEALGKERVLGVLMPNGIQRDINMSLDLVRHLDIQHRIINIGMLYSDMAYELGEILPEVSQQSKINVAPRLRMTILYAIAASMNGRVVGTSNYSEKYISFFTKWGDGACDLNPIGDLTCNEVIQIGHLLLPSEFVDKPPADGLGDGSSDEDKFGFTYIELDKYIRTGYIDNLKSKELIDTMHKNSYHKINPIPIYNYQI